MIHLLRGIISYPASLLPPALRKRLSVALSVTFGVIGLFLGLYQFAYRVYPAAEPITIELGSGIPCQPEDYLTGPAHSVAWAYVDISAVDPLRCGSYRVEVHHLFESYTCELRIEDTVAPVIRLRNGPFCFEKGTYLTTETFVSEVLDADRETTLEFTRDTYTKSMLMCENLGEFRMAVQATDSSGNTTRIDFSYIVDLPPSLIGIRPIYVATGTNVPYLSGVKAEDFVDGDVTDTVVVDDSEVNYDAPGQYRVEYSVTDSYGLTEKQACSVTIDSADHIQSLIGSRVINRHTASIYGAYNPYDTGRLQTSNLDRSLSVMMPTVVMLYHPVGRKGYVTGSGFIMEISDDAIYICTNQHVIKDYSDWQVWFYDGTMLEGTKLGTTEYYDVGVITVPLSDASESLLEEIGTVHIDETYWKTLDADPLLLGLVRLGKEGLIQHSSSGTLIKVKQNFLFYFRNDHTEFTVPLVNGDSGSAIFDAKGDLISMAFAYSLSPGIQYWGIPLDGLLDSYESITGHRPYTY